MTGPGRGRLSLGPLAMIASLGLAACLGCGISAENAGEGSAQDSATPTPTIRVPAWAPAGPFGGGLAQLDVAQANALFACLEARGIEVLELVGSVPPPMIARESGPLTMIPPSPWRMSSRSSPQPGP